MAFYNPEEEEQDPNQEASGGVQTGPGSSVITGGENAPTNTPNSQPAGSPDSGGNFVGLKTYLDANKNQASKLGDQTSGVLSNSVNQAQESVSGLNSKFNQAVDQNTVTQDQEATNLVGSTPESLSEDQKNQLKKQYSASYKGPTGLADLGDDYTQALKTTNQASQNIQDAQTEAGRGNLIKQVNSKPRTTGATTFDNILLQTGPGGDKLQAVASQHGGVKDLLTNSEKSAQQKVGTLDDPNTPDVNEASGAKGTTAQTQASTYKAVQDALNSWKTGFDPKLAAAQDVSVQNRLTQDLGDGDYNFSQETMDALGLNPEQSLYKLNLNDYINPYSVADINAANVASDEDYAKYLALSEIAGLENPILKAEDRGKAGTAGPFSLNKEKFVADRNKAEADYNNAYKKDVVGAGGTAEQLEQFLRDLGSSPDMGDGLGQSLYSGTKDVLEKWKASQGLNNVAKLKK